jgi:hypothetical protein
VSQMSTANEIVPEGLSRLAAYLRAIEDMWPDDREAMHSSDRSSEQAFSSSTRDSRKRLSSSGLQWSAHATSVYRALADMWPDEHEVMLALGET